MPKKSWILALMAWLIFGAGQAATAAGGRFSVRVWRTEDGLPENAVLALTQARDGYLWVGTLNGLSRFDGDRFTSYDDNNTPGLTICSRTASRTCGLGRRRRVFPWSGMDA